MYMIIDVIWYAIFSHNRLAGFILGVVHGLHFSEVITPKNPFQIGQDLLNQPTIGPIGWNVPFFWSNVGTALTITQIWKFRKLEEISATGVRNLALSFKVGSFFCHTIDHVFFYITVRAGSCFTSIVSCQIIPNSTAHMEYRIDEVADRTIPKKSM